MIRPVLFAASLLCLAFAPQAQAAMAIDVSSNIIRVTTGFVGTSLTVFGTQDSAGSVVIVVEGPPKNITVRQKSRVLGMWTNTGSRRFVSVPAFYEVAATGPLDLIAPPEVLQQNRIGFPNLLMTPQKNDDGTSTYAAALVRMQQAKKLYVQDVAPLNYPGPLLFKAQFSLPAIVPPGQYKASAFLFREGAVIDQDSVTFVVVPEGLSAELRRFATNNGLLYGLSGILMAVIAGWLATVLLKRE